VRVPERSRRAARSWAWFVAWLVVGTSYALVFLGAFTIGIFILPVSVALTIFTATRRDSGVGLPGLIAAGSIPLLYVAYINRSGPGQACHSISGGEQCTQLMTPWPWLFVGAVLAISGIAVFLGAQSKRGRLTGDRP
jgi:hypothetical protein